MLSGFRKQLCLCQAWRTEMNGAEFQRLGSKSKLEGWKIAIKLQFWVVAARPISPLTFFLCLVLSSLSMRADGDAPLSLEPARRSCGSVPKLGAGTNLPTGLQSVHCPCGPHTSTSAHTGTWAHMHTCVYTPGWS